MKYAMYLNEKENYCGYKDFLDTNAKGIGEVARFLAKQ